MGIPVMILGESGTGKSASLRNFTPEEIKVINVAGKPLPFKNKFESVSTDDYSTVKRELKNTNKKCIVVDDSQYLMANEFMRRATERGYDKFTEIAQNMWDLICTVQQLPNDVIVYFLTHLERDQNGFEKVKTIGKLLDEKITLEGMFTIVLKTNVTDGQYSFLTQNNGHDTVKSPIGMFPSYAIENDLKYVDDKIRNYYEIGNFVSDEVIAEKDKEVEKPDIVPVEEKPKRRRRTVETADATPTVEKEVDESEAIDLPQRKERTPEEEPQTTTRRRRRKEV